MKLIGQPESEHVAEEWTTGDSALTAGYDLNRPDPGTARLADEPSRRAAAEHETIEGRRSRIMIRSVDDIETTIGRDSRQRRREIGEAGARRNIERRGVQRMTEDYPVELSPAIIVLVR